MIRINLLPPELRRKAGRSAFSRLKRLPWKFVGMAAGGIFVFYSGWIFLADQLETRMLARLNLEWQNLQPQRNRLEQTQAVVAALKNQIAMAQSIKAPKAQWAPRLNFLSDAMVSGLWFTSLRFEGGKGSSATLLLKGSSLVLDEKLGPPVSRYLQRMKEHPDLSRWFRGLELKGVEHRQIQGQEVSDFVILFYTTGP